MSTSSSLLPARPAGAHDEAGALASAEAVTTTAALERLRPEWERLWQADPQATPFQSPQWLLPWWKHLGRGALLSVAVRGDCGELVGLAPLYRYSDGVGGSRQLFPIGIATTDYLGLLARPGWEQRVTSAVLAQLAAWQAAWDVLELPQLHRGAPVLALQAPPGWRVEISPDAPNPVLPLPRFGPAPIPKGIAANLRTCRNRAARMGALQHETAGAREIPAFLAALASLHASRWSERGWPGVLADADVLACHAEAAPLLHAAGMLRLHGLRLAGELIAVLYCLLDPAPAHQRRCCYYLGGFDPRHAGLSPGSLLLVQAIEQAMAEGATAFDFLRGAEPYKYRWGAVDQAMWRLRLWHRRTASPAHVRPE